MIIGYTFKNRSLLHEAFTHPSYHKDCGSYERLEYVGDSVLSLLITKEQFSLYPNLPPGLLTPLRAANVDTEKLARVAVQHNFHRYIRLGTPILKKQIQAFIDVLPKHPLHSHGLINAPKVLADVVESTVGAVFIDSDCSVDKTWEVASDLLKPIITPEMLQTNPVKKLFEICQKYKLKVKLVDLWSEEGTYKVFVNNQLRGKENNEEEEKYSQEKRVKAIKDITGYEFKDPILLQQAFTHHSYEDQNCSSNERLEYIGDSVLNFLISKEHFLMYPDLDPGKLTRLRSVNVDTEKLARVSFKHELYKFLRHNKPLLAGQINEFRDAIVEYPLHSSGLIDAPKVLADIVESLVGAIYIDSNFSMDTTWKVLIENIFTTTN
ncbi:hypothetical protein RD792_000117 [Penstemon davidsonii]|uniref:RNase III domain-containing protein n=1 Tax=Penstemon davidsonii TaxID=160366 RepID=A0ABR0DU77_9LAMI|nr:hypothetical protein RD792_000117 [Penstemon davidsonii]